MIVATTIMLLGPANLIMAMKSILYRRTYAASAARLHSSGKTISAAVFMPCKGIEEDAEEFLRSMLNQDYPDYRVYFITESEEDPATEFLRGVAGEYPNAKVVVAGMATECCQKNHNLLAGIAEEMSLERPADAFVFADADVKPGKTWLRDLTLPLTDDVHATTAFRWLKPEKFSFWGTMHAMLSAYMGTLMSSSDGMWGGSMAIKREVFEKYGIGKRWSRAVADDISLMEIVIKNGLKREFVPTCLAENTSVIKDGRQLYEWFLRQVQYLKIYCRFHWIAAIVFTGLNALAAVTLLSLTVFFMICSDWLTAGISFALLVIFLMIFSLSRLEGKEGQSYLTWVLMAFPALMMGTACLIGSIFRKTMIWRGIRYGINDDGTVSSVTVEKKNG